RAARRYRRRVRTRRPARPPPPPEPPQVACPTRCGALGRRGLEGISRAAVGDPVAALRHITGARGRAADRRALRISRTVDTRARAGLRQVAHPRRRTTRRARVPSWVLARIARAVALVEGAGVAVGGARSEE